MALSDRTSLFVFGGNDPAGILLNDLWRFDLGLSSQPSQNNRSHSDAVLFSWSEHSSKGVMPSPRKWHGLVATADGTKLYLFGGYDGTNDLNDLWRFTICEFLLIVQGLDSNSTLAAQELWLNIKPRTIPPLPRDRHSMVRPITFCQSYSHKMVR